MAYTQTNLDAIREAIATGATTVSFEGRSVTYRNLDEMRRVEAIISESLAGASARVFVVQTSRGLS